MAAHRYWRLLCRLNAGDASFTGLTEVQMRTVSGGANVVSGGTPISTGAIQAGSAAQCFDGNTTTTLIQWSGTGAGEADSVGYDFGLGVTKDIVELVVWPDKDAAARAFGEFDVQFSDDNSTWTTYWSCTATGWVVGTSKTFTQPSAAAHRYWRIRPQRVFNGATSGFGIAEVEMKETVGGADATGSGTPSARTTFAGTSAANAFDNSSATIYSHNTAVMESDWLQYDFGVGVTKSIVEVTLLPRQDSSWQQAPTSGLVESSPDAINFLPRFSFSRAVGGEDYTMRVIDPASLPSPPAGKRRMWGLKPSTVQSGTSFGVAEIELRATVGGAAINSGGAGAAAKEPFNGTANLPTKAYDGNTGTEYSSDGTLPDILVYDFGIGNEKAVPAQLKVTARINGGVNNQNQAPTAFDLVYSDDGQTFTTQESFTSPATWTASEARLFTVTSAPANGRRRELINC